MANVDAAVAGCEVSEKFPFENLSRNSEEGCYEDKLEKKGSDGLVLEKDRDGNLSLGEDSVSEIVGRVHENVGPALIRTEVSATQFERRLAQLTERVRQLEAQLKHQEKMTQGIRKALQAVIQMLQKDAAGEEGPDGVVAHDEKILKSGKTE